MEPSGRNQWQSLAKQTAAKTAEKRTAGATVSSWL
jgi:hypothetical protein